MTVVRGRRPGKLDTRALIVDAAREVFSERGYGGASIREIARHAGVDPALVHHYFLDKGALFLATIGLQVDPKEIQHETGRHGFSGERLVERFLASWDEDGGTESSAFLSLVQAVAASREAAENLRQFVAERVGLFGAPGDSEAMKLRRRSLVSSQLLGIAWNRYVMRMEPIASASRADVARWAGPSIDRYATGDIPD